MNYHNITKCDMKNGEGIRVVLWVSHCTHMCKGCHNIQTWDKNSGVLFDEAAKLELFEALDQKYIQGITFSGGDPLSCLNRQEITELVKDIHYKYPEKDIWIYTGYRWEEISDIKIVQYINVLVDGKFEKKLSVPSPKWCGSSNQRVIDVKESLKQNKIILADI